MDKKKIIIPLFIILAGILLILSGGFINEFIVVPNHNPDESYSMSTAEIVASALKIFGWIPILSGAVLFSVNFARSVSPSSRRIQIQQYIEKHPGCSEADVVKNTGHSRSSTVHHIQRTLSSVSRFSSVPVTLS